jgi:hypothetical protein
MKEGQKVGRNGKEKLKVTKIVRRETSVENDDERKRSSRTRRYLYLH